MKRTILLCIVCFYKNNLESFIYLDKLVLPNRNVKGNNIARRDGSLICGIFRAGIGFLKNDIFVKRGV